MSDYDQLSFADLAEAAPRRGEMPLPEGAKLDHCKSCKAEIVWAQTAQGWATPLSIATSQKRGGVTYLLPHWADCKDAKEWKGRKKNT